MNFDFSTGRKRIAEFSFAGLTDIVMQLLIFFLLTSSFVTQSAIKVTLPESTSAAPSEEQFVHVTITRDGQYYVADVLTAEDQLDEALAAAKGTRTAVVLRADQEATVRQFATVATAARALDLRVLMATTPRN